MRDDRDAGRANGVETAEQPVVCVQMRRSWRCIALTPYRYGVTRVYAQQCGYVLNDAEAAKNNMRLMFKVLRSSELDAAGEIQGR